MLVGKVTIRNFFYQPGGYFIVPLSIISELPKKWCYLDQQTAKAEPNDTVQTFDEKLIVDTAKNRREIGTDSTAGWFAYIWKDLLILRRSLSCAQNLKRWYQPILLGLKIV